jgi:TPR repeat protein
MLNQPTGICLVREEIMKAFISMLLMAASAPLALGIADQTDLTALKQKALAGDPAAQVQVGMSYALGSPRNVKEAIKWMQMAANQGYADGEYRLGGILDVGVVPQNPTEAIKWYTKAAAQGYRDAEYRLGVMYDHGRGVTRDYAIAAQWYTKAAEQGRAEAQYRLGMMYEDGQGVHQDYRQAMNWYLQAAAQNRPEAEFKVGSLYEHGYGVAPNQSQAIAWYQKSDQQGYAYAHDALKAIEQQQ